jgi:hypothetical protein
MITVPGTIGLGLIGLGIIGADIIGEGERDIGLGIIGSGIIGDRLGVIGLGIIGPDIGLGPVSTFVNSGRGEFRITSVIFSVSRGVSISTISPCLFTYRTVGTPDTDFFSESGVF